MADPNCLGGDLLGSDSDDSDYVPSGQEDEAASEDELEVNNKRAVEEIESTPAVVEAKKSRIDDLWADFATSYEPAAAASKSQKPPVDCQSGKSSKPQPASHAQSSSAPDKISTKSTESAPQANGECDSPKPKQESTSELQTAKSVSDETVNKHEAAVKTQSQSQTFSAKDILKKKPIAASASGGGFGSALAAIKTKKTTLAKSQEDWQKFKDEKQLNEELQTHNRGKDGYIERQDFLNRVDNRTFEVEKGMRNARRK